MADVTYTVEVQYLTKGSLLDGLKGNGGVNQTINQLNQSLSQSLSQNLTQKLASSFSQSWRTTIYNKAAPEVEKTGNSFGALLSAGMVAGLATSAVEGAVHGFGRLIKTGLVEMNADIEQLGITMAMMFSGSGQARDFNEGLLASRELMKQMRVDARELPGEFKDLANIMMRVATPAAKAGLSVRDTEELSANAMAIGVGAGMNADVVGREVGDLIQGHMRRMMPILKILPNFDIDSKTFNAMSPEKRVARLKQALGMVQGTMEFEAVHSMRKAFEHSWIGLWSTLKDQAKQVLGGMTAMLFDNIKGTLVRFNDWFAGNQSKIEDWARRVGFAIGHGFQVAAYYAEKMLPLVEKTGKWLGHRYSNDSTIGRDAGMVGSAVLVGSLLKSVLPLLGGAGEAVGGLGMSGAIGAMGGGGLLASLIPLASVFAVVAGLAVMVYGAFEGLTNILSPVHETITGLAESIWGNLQVALVSLEHAFETAWPAMRRVAEVLGGALMFNIDAAVNAFTILAQGIDMMVTKIADLWHSKLKPILISIIPGLEGNPLLEPDSKVRFDYRKEQEKFEVDLGRMRAAEKPPEHTTHIHRVEIKVNSNQDPNRVAKRTVDVLQDLARHPKSYHNSGNPNLSNY